MALLVKSLAATHEMAPLYEILNMPPIPDIGKRTSRVI